MSKGLLDVVKEWREVWDLDNPGQSLAYSRCAKEAQPFLDRLEALEREWLSQSGANEQFEKDWLAGKEKSDSDSMLMAQGAYKQQREDARELHAILHGDNPNG